MELLTHETVPRMFCIALVALWFIAPCVALLLARKPTPEERRAQDEWNLANPRT